MMGAIHTLIGGAVGSLMKSRTGAFLAGVASHAPSDQVPHKDFPAGVEGAAFAAALLYIARRHGLNSPAMAGAIGGILPDVENVLVWLGLMQEGDMVFPTHYDADNHGEPVSSASPQVGVAAACVGILEIAARRKEADGDAERS